MNFIQVDQLLIPEARKRKSAHLFAVGQSQDRYISMLNGANSQHQGPGARHEAFNDCLEHMFRQECSDVATAGRSCYLEEIHSSRISKAQISEAVQIIIQFGM